MEENAFTQKVYATPKIDVIMTELGWQKPLEEVPIFVKENTNYNKDAYGFIMIFPVDFHGHYGIYEKWINEGHDVKKNLENILVSWPKMYVTKEAYQESLLLLATDFYRHQYDFAKASEWQMKYEKETGKLY
jgi:hypothetical protein